MHPLQFSAADRDLSPQIRRLMKFLRCFLCKVYQLLGSAPQQHSLIGQNNMVSAAVKELYAQFFLQLH